MSYDQLTANLVSENAALRDRVNALEQRGPPMQRGFSGDGTPWMGTMRDCLGDAQRAAMTEARLGDEARKQVRVLRPLLHVLDSLLVDLTCECVTSKDKAEYRAAIRAALEATKP